MFVADLICQDIICGTLYGRFFHLKLKILPIGYLAWYFWLKLAFSSVTW